MKKLCFILLTSLTLAACQEVPEDLKRELSPDDKVETVVEAETDVTDRSACRGPTPIGQTVLRKAFRLDLKSVKGYSIQDIYLFESNRVTLSRTCFTEDLQTTIQVRANATVTNRDIQILTTDFQESWLPIDGTDLTCAASLRGGQRISYSFEGPCLKAKFGKVTRTLVPQ